MECKLDQIISSYTYTDFLLILLLPAQDVAQDVRGQEIIASEVAAFFSEKTAGKQVKEEDLYNLQERIRSRLTGGTPM